MLTARARDSRGAAAAAMPRPALDAGLFPPARGRFSRLRTAGGDAAAEGPPRAIGKDPPLLVRLAALPAEAVELSQPSAAKESVPLVRGEPENRPFWVPAVAYGHAAL